MRVDGLRTLFFLYYLFVNIIEPFCDFVRLGSRFFLATPLAFLRGDFICRLLSLIDLTPVCRDERFTQIMRKFIGVAFLFNWLDSWLGLALVLFTLDLTL